ncbi:MAG: 3-oxoacid CoA-transferase subunit A [Alphaproteobacteria bacterium]|nr:3-oxoacid CoA-transferase subunit A [Alphaproteobacteria bacterium]
MINKIVPTLEAALDGIEDGATILVGGFGEIGTPNLLLGELLKCGTRQLTIVTNNAGVGDAGIAALLRAGAVRKIVCSYPRSAGSIWFEEVYAKGELELELVPQGTLTERIRAGGAGIGGFYTRTAVGTQLAEGKETRVIDGQTYLLEHPIHADVAFIRAHSADRWGNLTYHASARNFGPVMAPAARLTIAEVVRTVALGGLNPEHIVTPGIFVDRVWSESHD